MFETPKSFQLRPWPQICTPILTAATLYCMHLHFISPMSCLCFEGLINPNSSGRGGWRNTPTAVKYESVYINNGAVFPQPSQKRHVTKANISTITANNHPLHGASQTSKEVLIQVPFLGPISGLQLRMRETVWFSHLIIQARRWATANNTPFDPNCLIKIYQSPFMVLVRHLRRSSFRYPSGTHIWTPTANARNGVILSSRHTSTQVRNGQQHTLWPKLSHQDISKSLHGASQTSKEVLIQKPFWDPYLDSNCECEKRCDSLISSYKHAGEQRPTTRPLTQTVSSRYIKVPSWC